MKQTFFASCFALACLPMSAHSDVTDQNLTDLYNWAEQTFPSYFPSIDAPIQTLSIPEGTFKFAFYPQSGNYLGYKVEDQQLYVFGNDFPILSSVGLASNFFSMAGIQINTPQTTTPETVYIGGSWNFRGTISDCPNTEAYYLGYLADLNNDGYIDSLTQYSGGQLIDYSNCIPVPIYDSIVSDISVYQLPTNATVDQLNDFLKKHRADDLGIIREYVTVNNYVMNNNEIVYSVTFSDGVETSIENGYLTR